MNARTIELFGESNFEKIKNLNICVVGIGGVGGMAAEMFVRTGVQNITIIDADVVDKTNLNRQIVALTSTIGKPKVEVMKERIQDINPSCQVVAIQEFLTEQNVAKLIQKFDYVIDCIDSVSSKVALIEYCKKNNINIVSALGAGNRKTLPSFEIIDIFQTSNDGLAKALRKKLREKGMEKLDVACAKTLPDITKTPPASIMWQPTVCASTLVAFVIEKITTSKC